MWYFVLLWHENLWMGNAESDRQHAWGARWSFSLYRRVEDVYFWRLWRSDRSVLLWCSLLGPSDDAVELYSHVSLNIETHEIKLLSTVLSHSYGSPPSYRDFHTATVINDRMYIFGGRGDVQSPYHSQDEIYCPKIVYLDLNTHQWIMPMTLNKQPLGRRSHSACKFQLLPCWHIQLRHASLMHYSWDLYW